MGLERQPGEGAQQERGGRSSCRGRGPWGVIAPVAKATAVLAREVALLLPDKGRVQTRRPR